MIRRTMLFRVKEHATTQQVAELEGLVRETPKKIPCVTSTHLGRNLYDSSMPDGWGKKWTHVWDFSMDDRKNIPQYRDSEYHMNVLMPVFSPTSPTRLVEKLTVVYFEPKVFSAKNRDKKPFKQQLIYQIKPDAAKEQIERFDRMMLDMPKAMPLIRNWCLGTPFGATEQHPWTRVWEWEFLTQKDFQTYLDHKTHMDVVPFFDPASLVAQRTNAQYQPEGSVITY